MNSIVRNIMIILNVIVLFIGFLWYYNPVGNYEPLSIIILQIISLLALLNENKISKIITKQVENSEIDIDSNNGQDIVTKKITDSKIRIKTK
jgi:hypothetical protein